MSIRIFLLEDQDNADGGLKSLLAAEPGIEIVGETFYGPDIFSKIHKAVLPDILFMDLNKQLMSRVECVRQLKQEFPSVKMLIQLVNDSESCLATLLGAGADGYVLKNSPRGDLLFAIDKIMSGSSYISSEFTWNLLDRYKAASPVMNQPKKEMNITSREMDVLALIAQGLTNTEMARRLFTSVRTIETRRKKLLEKTGTTNTATLIRFAILSGLIK